MSRINDKRDVFTSIQLLSSDSGKIPRKKDSFSSVNNKKETIPFMLDVLKSVGGTEAVKILVAGLLTKVVKKSEPKLKTTLKKQFNQSNSNEPLPTSEVVMDVDKLDVNGKLKISPDDSSKGGNLLYSNNISGIVLSSDKVK